MTAVRHLALWFAAAIMMIGVSLTPSAARAHSGTAHHAAAGSHASTIDRVATWTRAESQRFDAAVIERAQAWPSCSDACCCAGSHAHCCGCAIGLAPSAALSLVPPMNAGEVLARIDPDRAAVVPEALPEPPRPSA